MFKLNFKADSIKYPVLQRDNIISLIGMNIFISIPFFKQSTIIIPYIIWPSFKFKGRNL